MCSWTAWSIRVAAQTGWTQPFAAPSQRSAFPEGGTALVALRHQPSSGVTRTLPPLGAGVGWMSIKFLGVQIRAFCALASRCRTARRPAALPGLGAFGPGR